MANKRYYWIKLKENFFDDDAISWIEEQKNGKEYCLFYLKLCLKSLRTDGKMARLVGDSLIPYNEKKLAEITKTKLKIVKESITLLKKVGLITICDTGEIQIKRFNEMTGSETEKAELMRVKRQLDKMIDSNNVTSLLPNCSKNVTQSIEYRDKSLDLEKEKDLKDIPPTQSKSAKARSPKHKYGEYEHVLLTDKEHDELIAQYDNYNELITFLDEYIEMKGYKAKNHYLAIKKWVVDAVEEHRQKKGVDTNATNQYAIGEDGVKRDSWGNEVL